MAAVMKVISTGGGKGVSTVTRYISERDRDPEKEGKEKRPLFSKDREGMTYRQADKVLARGEDAPEKDDVIHIAVSLRPGDYERLGATNEDRLKGFMQVTREAMQEVEEELGARDMTWVAGIHQNKANPHVHIAINKNMTDRETGKDKRVETIPRDMRGNKVVERQDEPQRGQQSQPERDPRLVTIEGFYTTTPGRVTSKNDFIQRGDGLYLALDKPFVRDPSADVVKRMAIDIDPSKILDPNGLLPGTDVERSRSDYTGRLEIRMAAEMSAVDVGKEGHRGIAQAHSRAVQSLGYEAEVGWIDGPEGENRELVIYDRARVREIEFEPGGNGHQEQAEQEPEREERGKIAHKFDDAIDHVAGPVTMIGFKLADKDVLLRRELVREGREPTENERKVGSWVLAEAQGRPGDEEASRERERLRSQVRDIDRETARAGDKQVAAHIPKNELREALDKGQLTALNRAGQKHSPYDGGDLERGETQRDPVLKDRTVLGQELAARFRSEYFSAKVDACVEQRDVRRYKIVDASLNLPRKSSAADIQGRATARGQRAAETAKVEKPSDRKEIKAETYRTDVSRHAENFIEIQRQHAEQLAKLTGKRDSELARHDRLLVQRSSIERVYRATGERLPSPIVPRAALDELHEQAVEQRDPARIAFLNELRIQMAQEFGGHARNDHSAARLAAQTDIAQQDLRVSERRAESFDKTAHLRKWEIGDQRLSLSDVDKETKYREGEVKFQEKRAEFYDKKLSFWGSFHLPSAASFNPINSIKSSLTTNPFKGIGSISFGPTINPIRRAEYREQAQEAREAARAAQEKIEALRPIRETIVDKIEGRRSELAEGVARDRAMAETLAGIRDAETADRSATGRQMPEAQYKGWELRRLEADAGLLRDAAAMQRFEHEVGPDRENINLEGRASRAFAREIHAEIVSTEAAERLESFSKNRDHYPLGYRDAEGNLRTGTLSEVKPHSLAERLTRFITESAEQRTLRETLEHAATETYNDLRSDRDKTAEYYQTAKAVAGEYREQLQAREPGQELPKPEYTRKELFDIERYGEALADHAQHQHYQDFVRDVIEGDHVGNHPVGQSFADQLDSKLSNDPEPEKSWQASAPETPGAPTPTAPEAPAPGGGTVEITGATADIEAGGGLAALL